MNKEMDEYSIKCRRATDVAMSQQESGEAIKKYIEALMEGQKRSSAAIGQILQQCGGDIYKDERNEILSESLKSTRRNHGRKSH